MGTNEVAVDRFHAGFGVFPCTTSTGALTPTTGNANVTATPQFPTYKTSITRTLRVRCVNGRSTPPTFTHAYRAAFCAPERVESEFEFGKIAF
jgi:hypothetical protein